MLISKIPITQINPAPYNPRKDLKPGDPEYEKLKKSILKFDLVEPLVWNKRSGNLVGGHQRFKIIKTELKADKAQVSVVDLSPQMEKALNVALNKIQGDWDLTKLKELLVELDDGSFDLNLTGFDELELKELIDYEGKKGLTDDDAVPEVPENPVTKPGDLYELGEHRLLCGDSLDIDQVKNLMDGQTIDMVFTDPPYGINAVKTVKQESLGSIGGAKAFGAVGRGGRTGNCDPFGGVKNMKGRVHGPARNAIIKPNLYAPVIGDDSTETAVGAFKLCASLGIETLIFWGGNYYADQLPPSRCWIVWDKENTGTFADGELAWTNIDAPLRIFRHMWNGLMKASERGERRVHPTQKPVALAEWCLSEFGKEAKTVLDLFGGSGSTLIACEKTNRRCLIMEMSTAYCDVIIKRWEQFTGKKAVLSNAVLTAGV